MRTTTLNATRLLVALVSMPLLACDKPGTIVRPSAQPVVNSVEVLGPEVVPVGQTVQFTLMARLPDGSTRDVTSEASWSAWWSAGDAPVSIARPGSVTGRTAGQSRITARFGPHEAWHVVLVLPAGTYRLTGRVNDAGTPTGPLNGAKVEVTAGVATGLTTFTDANGGYELYGVSGETHLRASKDGYHPAEQTLVVANNGARLDVELALLVPRADVSGNYTLTVAASDECAVGFGEGHLPQEARVRTYQAAIQQDGSRLAVLLSGASVRSGGWGSGSRIGFDGRVEPDRLVFELRSYDELGSEWPAILEEIAQSTLFSATGTATIFTSAGGLAGTLSGSLRILVGPGAWIPTASCTSANHQFVLSR